MERYKSIFSEKAIGVSNLIANDNFCLAILRGINGLFANIILYDRSKIKFDKNEKTVDFGLSARTFNSILTFGEMRANSKNPFGSWDIMRTAATQGFGPFLYDTMLSIAGEHGLMPDRGSVSKAAKAVWKYYFTIRKNEFDLIKLDNKEAPETKSKEDDIKVHYPKSNYARRHFIDYIYIWKNSEAHSSSLTPLIKRHTDMILVAKQNKVSKNLYIAELYNAGDVFFNLKYYR